MAHVYKPQDGHASLLTFFFALCAIGALVAAGSHYFQYELLQLALKGDDISQQQAVVNDLRQLGVALGQAVLFIVTGVLFCVWVFQSQANARLLGASELKATPGWAVASFFIPIINLTAPYTAMVELWRASDPNVKACDAQMRAKLRISPLLGAWWLTWLLAAGVGTAANMMVQGAADASSTARATSVQILASVVWMLCCLFAAFVVRDITWRQTRRHEALKIAGNISAKPQAKPKPKPMAKMSAPSDTKKGAKQPDPDEETQSPTLLRCAPSGPDPSQLKPIIPQDAKKSA